MNKFILVHKSGIVHHYQVLQDVNAKQNDTLNSFIWGGMIQCTIVGLNKQTSEHSATKKQILY